MRKQDVKMKLQDDVFSSMLIILWGARIKYQVFQAPLGTWVILVL